MEFHPKTRIIKLFLDFVAGYTVLPSARLATLGGEGLEASIWQTSGITGDRGWLIESKRRLSSRLIRHFDFRFCSSLSSFPRMFQDVWGTKKGIDGFHLDLCGTYESGDKAFKPAIPLIMRSEGRCFAVTVADQRRNRSTERFSEVLAELECLIGGKAASVFFGKLNAEQRELIPAGVGVCANPALGAQRELGFSVRLVKSLMQSRSYGIDRIERYVYSSDKSSRSFQMRTYFFHFAKRGKGRARLVRPEETIRLWTTSSLQCVTAEGLKTIAVKSTPEKGKEKQMRKPTQLEYGNLEAIANIAGGKVKEEFNVLVAVAVRSAVNADAVSQISRVLKAMDGETPVPAATADIDKARKPRKGGKDSEQIEYLLILLTAKSKGEKELAAAKKDLATKLYGRKKNGLRRVGTAFARTQGRFMVGFAKRVLKHRPDLFGELAGLYGMSPDELRKKATK